MECVFCNSKCINTKEQSKPLRHTRKCPKCGFYYETSFGAFVRWITHPIENFKIHYALHKDLLEDEKDGTSI